VSSHAEALGSLPVPAAAIPVLAAYLDLLERWGRRVNLTAAASPEARAAQLIQPALGAVPLLKGRRLLDVGSGNGSPGLVLALLEPALDVVLLEPRTRRWAFLREAVRALGLAGRVRVERVRHDGYQGAPAETISVRAVALRAEELEPLLSPGGRLLIWRPGLDPTPGWRVVGRWDRGTALECST
jgi:16S rRNA (guanine527-N7)-methyltransferase